MPIYFCPLLNQPIITLFKVHCGLFWPERCSPKSYFSIRRINMCKEKMTFILRVTNWLLALNDITHSPFEIQSKAWNYYFLRRPDSVPRLFISTGSLWLLHREEVAARKFAHLLPKAKKKSHNNTNKTIKNNTIIGLDTPRPLLHTWRTECQRRNKRPFASYWAFLGRCAAG